MKQHLHHLLLHSKSQRVYLLVVIIPTSTVSQCLWVRVGKLSFGSRKPAVEVWAGAWSPRLDRAGVRFPVD